jgi:putative endonuclease
MYVYLLRSKSRRDQTYVGVTPDIPQRLKEHNAGLSLHTSKFIPWEVEGFLWFSDREKAYKFERWLKSGSGLAFRNRHL